MKPSQAKKWVLTKCQKVFAKTCESWEHKIDLFSFFFST
jgi:hypothetical protein